MIDRNSTEKSGVIVTANPKLRRVEIACVPDKDRALALAALQGIMDAHVRVSGSSIELVVRGDGAVTHHVAISARNALRSAGIGLAK